MSILFIGFLLAVATSIVAFVILDLREDQRVLGWIVSVAVGIFSSYVLVNLMTGRW